MVQSSANRDFTFMILRMLDHKKFKETIHKLEQESGLFFNVKYLEELVINGYWDEVETYLSGFTKIDDNCCSRKMFFQIRSHKFFEALIKLDRTKALDILVKELKLFSSSHENLFKELSQLLLLDDFRENEKLSQYEDITKARTLLLKRLMRLIQANPLFHDKLQFPALQGSRSRTLTQNPNDEYDHQLIGSASTSEGSASTSEGSFQMVANDMLMPRNSSVQNHHGLPSNIIDKLPITVACTLNQGSDPTSMDFHPFQQTLLLVGTNTGDISLWEVSSREKLVSKTFHMWNFEASSAILQESIVRDPDVAVRRILWSPDGSVFGVAYSKHIVQLYTYYIGPDIRNHLEIEAHTGSVNDLAFRKPYERLSIITCGDDKTIKLWDMATGANLKVFVGHSASVFSICPNTIENIHFIFSTSVDGKIKAWVYDSERSVVHYDSSGNSCITMSYSADGKRLFSCGTNQEGESHMVEWNEAEGSIKRRYRGFQKRSQGVVQFDTTKNGFMAVGDDYSVKFWDMDNPKMLTSIDTEGGLPASPRIRFNKEGMLLAVSASDNRIKILATTDGLHLMRTFEDHFSRALRVGIASETS